MRAKLIVLSILLLLLTVPNLVMAAGTHFFECSQCHLADLSPITLQNNLCLKCHDTVLGNTTTFNDGNPQLYNTAMKSDGKFASQDASNIYNTAQGGNENSHNWGSSATNAAAGATNPTSAQHPTMSGFRGRNTLNLNCARCHNPHGNYDAEGNPSLLVASDDRSTTMAVDDLCQNCHTAFSGGAAVPGNGGLLTHPLLNTAQLVALQADENKAPNYNNILGLPIYNIAAPYLNNVQLVNNASGNPGISCMSCHGLHFTDSNSTTADGPTAPVQTGDGLLLRSDGPTRTGVDRNETAQLRSNLCQTCHTYKLHGKTASSNRIGCLDCHGGHSYNDNTPSLYVLNGGWSRDAVPTRANRVFNTVKLVEFPSFTVAGDTGITWSDRIDGDANGFCEACHGDVQAGVLATTSAQHRDIATSECTDCHNHADVNMSFTAPESQTACGECHGFPPYKNIRGDRAAEYDTRDGGYAYYNSLNYNYETGPNSPDYKPEASTPHKAHAGRDLKSDAVTPLPGSDGWYFFDGALGGGDSPCDPCHGPNSGDDILSNHKKNNAGTFNDVIFDKIATYNGVIASAYNPGVDGSCTNIYCHSAGAPRTGDSTRNTGAGLGTTPTWNNGNSAILGKTPTLRCQTCHGNDTASMNPAGTTDDNTWEVHDAHINPTLMAAPIACGTCHVNTAIDGITLSANATDHRAGGQHVNGVADVAYDTTVYNSALSGAGYDSEGAGTGTCSMYCHDVPDAVNTGGTGRFEDWDNTGIGTLACDSCHGGLASDGIPIETGSHARHIKTGINGPTLSCAECHGADSDAGTHAGHVNGVIDYITLSVGDRATFGNTYPQNICDRCHGYASSDTEVAFEIRPEWGVPSTTDCATCHAGSICGASFNNGQDQSPEIFSAARTGGHNRPLASSNYNSGNVAANLGCDDCHITDSPNHFDGDTGLEADLLLRTDQDGYNSSYLGGLENNYCLNCHGDSPAHPTGSASNPNSLAIQTHSAKKCVACHNVHGDEANNIQMVWSSRVAQNEHDDTFGQYRGSNVFFTNNSNFNGIGLDSYDEDDGDDGAASEDGGANADDICAVCHSDGLVDGNFLGNPVDHNNIEGTGDHSQDVVGTDCFDSCHSVHNDPGGAFLPSGGTSCSGCHDYPPDTAAHNLHAVEMVSRTAIDTDDQTDCENCHTGASSYTYNTNDDKGNSLNHSDDTGRLGILFNSVGFTKGAGNRWTCTKACHNTDTSDGYWYTWDNVNSATLDIALRTPFDSDGLACDKCHYYADAGSENANNNTNHGLVGDGRAEKISEISHNDHFLKSKSCGACHDIGGVDYANGSPLPGPLAHIDDRTGGNRGAIYNGAAMALKDEAGSDVLPALTYNSANTCATAGGVGCHAGSTTANWDTPFDGTTNTGCLECHTVNGNPAYDPFSGLHINTTDPTVTGNSHDDSFDDGTGVADSADCITCHTASPTITAGDHIDGTLDDGVDKITVYANAGYNSTTNTCATVAGCHTSTEAGTSWEYKWSTDAYLSTGAECANCHGRWSDWRTGVTHRMDGVPQGTHGSVGYGCKDCHALDASSGNYAFTSGTNDWNETVGETSNHGDGLITINAYNTAFVRNVGGGSDLSGCSECHAADDGTSPGQYSFTTTVWTNSSVLGDQVPITCSSCHGGTNPNAVDESNFWPSGSNVQDDSDGAKNNSGAHELHMIRLAEAVYPDDATPGNPNATLAALFTDVSPNYAGNAEARQTELCAYCHNNPGVNPGHNDDGGLPAETLASANDSNTPGQGFFPLWDTNRSGSRDSADYDVTGSGSCYVSSCHYDRATDANATNYGWYADNSTSCELCHNPDSVDTNLTAGGRTHQEHLNSASLTGRDITCNDCHQTATEDVSWSPGVAPSGNHINNTYMDALSGSVTYTYNLGTDKSCNTNDCHNLGDGITAPKTASYPWDGPPLADCSICHLDPPDTDTHPVHMASTSYVVCLNCHEPGTDPTHMDTFVTYNTTTIGNPPGDGSCTNTCHDAGDALDWQGSFTTLACADCHNASASIADLPTSGLHVTSNVTIHDGTLGTPDGNCVNCHDAAAPVSTANHGDGSLHNAATISYTFNSATVVGYNPATGCMAALPCHSDDGDWRRKWTGFVDEIPTGAHIPGVSGVCDNCHGSSTTFDDPTQWRWDEASNSDHTDPYASNPQGSKMDAHGDCETCHGWGHADYDQEWGAPGINNGHGDGSITMNGPADTGAKYNVATGSCDNAGCHSPANSPDYNLQYNSGFTLNYGDFGGGSGGPCDSCHGGSGYYAPNVSPGSFPNRAGLHLEHITAMEVKGIGHSTTCTYCHGDDPGTADWHQDATATLPQHNAAILGYRRIIGGAIDADGFFNFSGVEKSTCSNIDCHFDNSYTPHWYDSDNVAPGAVTNLANVATLEPSAIKVTYNSPGADAGLDNTTSYRYDARVSYNAISTGAQFNAATLVGGLPASYLSDELTEVTVSNLNHTNSYYFAVRAQDTEGLWGPIESIGPIAPLADTTGPMFHGADKALAGDEGGSVNLYWTQAEDHSMYVMDPSPTNRIQKPIRYEIWLKSEVRGDLDMNDNTGYNSPILWDDVTTFYTGKAIELEGLYNHSNGGVSTTIQDDITYQMGVRACDYLDNCETNTTVVSATPAASPTVPKSVHDYVSGGGTLLTREGDPGTVSTPHALSSGNPLTFYGASQNWDVDYYVDNFVIQYTEDRTASTVTANLGKWTGSCGGFVASSTIFTASKATGAMATFKFGAVTPVFASTGESFCIQLSTTNAVDLAYGTAATGGAGVVVEQKSNTPPNPITGEIISLNGAIVTASWNQPADDLDGLTTEETLHYDIYGSNQNGAAGSWDYVLAENQAWDDTDVEWDTQADGITSGSLAIKIRPGDGFSHTAEGSSTFLVPGTVDAIDKIPPDPVEDLKALPRPKQGTVELRWTCPGDDYKNNGRASYYEVRYKTLTPITDFNTATLVENAPPYPEFGKHLVTFEVTGLPLETPLYFALKTFDEQNLGSPMSNVFGPVNSGPNCGMCHTTGPSVVESEGNHKLHGFTLSDCDKCHDDGLNPVSSFGLDHQDGVLVMGYGPGGAKPPAEIDKPTNTIIYTNNGSPMDDLGDFVIYQDTDGWGGFGTGDFDHTVGDNEDDGSCYNFGAMGVGGCHGPAGSDPDSNSGLSEYPLFETPDWTSEANLDCGRCHGNPNRAETATGWTDGTYKKDPYGRDYDGTLYNSPTKPAGVVPDQILGSPGADNRGGWDPSGAGTVDERKYIGQHEKHLNYSFRFSKGDSCSLCHYGHYDDINNLDGKHGDGFIDVELDRTASGPLAHYNSAGSGVAGQCFSMDPYNCHPTTEAPFWDTTENFPCIGCHTMGNNIANIGHYQDLSSKTGAFTIDDSGSPWYEGNPGNCTWCHFPGHPTDDVDGTALILPNNPQVGVSYKSGGIHLRKQPGGADGDHIAYATQAELCWGCHDEPGNDISEWGVDDAPFRDLSIQPANGNNYDFGELSGSDWTTATWSSAYSSAGNQSATPYFEYKTGPIMSTHSTNITYGNSAVLLSGGEYVESPDDVADLQCHNCHDVHNMNFAKGDEMSGPPYLRGSWLSNPYKEDGAPRKPSDGNTIFTSGSDYGPVPRGGTAYNEMGGFQIDQNNGHASGPPTKGWVASTAGGLCLLCHGANGVDGMDQVTGEDLWIIAGRNGHSNSALGGTADELEIADIFSFADRNPTLAPQEYTANDGPADKAGNPAMGYVNATGLSSTGNATDYWGDGFRSNRGVGWSTLYASPDVTPLVDFPYVGNFDWGVTQDTGTKNKGYHAFSCSKCHNPHASRLPKLMITNCLDTKQNTWDDQWAVLAGSSTQGGSTLSDDNAGMRLSNTTSAQNCHRLGDPGQGVGGGTGAGWNLVTPRNVMPPTGI